MMAPTVFTPRLVLRRRRIVSLPQFRIAAAAEILRDPQAFIHRSNRRIVPSIDRLPAPAGDGVPFRKFDFFFQDDIGRVNDRTD